MKSLVIVLLAVVIAGCASGSAPLVDLPAPISGHINISNPDSDGNVLVAGSAGAVDGGSMVMVVNETTTGISAVMILDLLVKPAYAQSSAYPSICNTTGRACTVASTDGSFTVTIPAAIGDSLAIGIIDSSGSWISEVLRRDVPSTETESCADSGANGAVVDIKVIAAESSGAVYAMLKQGSEDTPNQLVIGSSATEGEVFDIEGCHAHSLGIRLDPTEGVSRLVVTSKEDKIIWFGTFDGSDLVETSYVTLENEPMDVNYTSEDFGPIVALKGSTSVTLAEISETDGSVVQSMAITDSNSGVVEGLTRSSRIGVMKMTDGQFFGMLITDKGDAAEAYLTLFLLDGLHEDGLHEYVTMQNGFGLLYKLETLPDGSLWSFRDGPDHNFIRLVLIGEFEGSSLAQTFEIQVVPLGADNEELRKEISIDDQSSISISSPLGASPEQTFGFKNIDIVIQSSTQTHPEAYRGIITTSKGNLFSVNLALMNEPTQAKEIPLTTVAANSDLVAISILNSDETAYVADGTSGKAVNADEAFPY